MIYPPNNFMLGDGADCDWPGPDYETVERSVQDERHRHSGPRDWRYYLDENPYW